MTDDDLNAVMAKYEGTTEGMVKLGLVGTEFIRLSAAYLEPGTREHAEQLLKAWVNDGGDLRKAIASHFLDRARTIIGTGKVAGTGQPQRQMAPVHPMIARIRGMRRGGNMPGGMGKLAKATYGAGGKDQGGDTKAGPTGNQGGATKEGQLATDDAATEQVATPHGQGAIATGGSGHNPPTLPSGASTGDGGVGGKAAGGAPNAGNGVNGKSKVAAAIRDLIQKRKQGKNPLAGDKSARQDNSSDFTPQPHGQGAVATGGSGHTIPSIQA